MYLGAFFMDRHSYLSQVKRLVIKIGSGVLIDDSNGKTSMQLELLDELVGQIAALMKAGYDVLLVSSGAIAFGMLHLGLSERPKEISKKQACAAIGQSHLIHHYEQLFAKFSIKVAQVLLSREDLEDKQRYTNATQTFSELLQWKVLPIVNENDSVAVDEIKIGDNDNLSALVAVAVQAQLLVILSHVDGIYTDDPKTHAGATLLSDLAAKDLGQLTGVSGNAASFLNVGGMSTKVEAAQKAAAAGIATAIVNGRLPKNLSRLLQGERVGTFIL